MWDSFRSGALATGLLERIKKEAADRRVKIMEVCGTHTVALSRSGIRQALRGFVEFVSGPGCPVCVTDPRDLAVCLRLARLPGVTVVTYGDLARVPLGGATLLSEKARGADVHIVYSARAAVEMARERPERRVVFLGIGFETTAPGAALALRQAAAEGLRNFYLLSLHKLVPPALRALVEDPGLQIYGFLLPGHVSTVIGRRSYDFMARQYGRPAVVTGFEPVDILAGVLRVMLTPPGPQARVWNLYPRVVPEEGNPRAQELLAELFEPVAARWRGLGLIPASGLGLRSEYGRFDARHLFPPPPEEEGLPLPEAEGCLCGEILKGKALPTDCPLFGRGCAPDRPVGACMVSSEGACAAYLRFGDGGDAG